MRYVTFGHNRAGGRNTSEVWSRACKGVFLRMQAAHAGLGRRTEVCSPEGRHSRGYSRLFRTCPVFFRAPFRIVLRKADRRG